MTLFGITVRTTKTVSPLRENPNPLPSPSRDLSRFRNGILQKFPEVIKGHHLRASPPPSVQDTLPKPRRVPLKGGGSGRGVRDLPPPLRLPLRFSTRRRHSSGQGEASVTVPTTSHLPWTSAAQMPQKTEPNWSILLFLCCCVSGSWVPHLLPSLGSWVPLLLLSMKGSWVLALTTSSFSNHTVALSRSHSYFQSRHGGQQKQKHMVLFHLF